MIDALTGVCENCRELEAKRKRQEIATAEEQMGDLLAAADTVVLTTEPVLSDRHLVSRVGMVGSQCAFGMNALKDVSAGIRDVVGGRARVVEDTLRDAREAALRELKREAALVGANAVVSVMLELSEFSGGGKSMLFVMAYGTAVVVADGE
ncbi:YbjQ family protein [Tabrizicola oligotrophica]|uniref:UPF0145 protein G4Z14_14865 n=1 Tax=Tabrizicola oligotrophica TaxID=2710650 RepID=A0A6M0QXB7_9RHOB|nr:heavy metal-binding domain-containing protein [Tabrizicola oligotrophica]NEY91581.1 YbjQ family protein [Tabrizicola oligotrophica]